MQAQVGDRLAAGGDHERIGLILKVPHADGTPPYVVKWLATGHIAMVMPGQFARIIPAERAAVPDEDQSDAAWSETKVWDSRGART
jgi:Domain of unknown function (DUF1918)